MNSTSSLLKSAEHDKAYHEKLSLLVRMWKDLEDRDKQAVSRSYSFFGGVFKPAECKCTMCYYLGQWMTRHMFVILWKLEVRVRE